MLYLSTTIKGLEDVAKKELHNLGAQNFKVLEGKVIYEGDENLFYYINYRAKTVNRVVILYAMEDFKKLEDIKRIVLNSEMCFHGTFGVDTERHGKHDFTSMDVNVIVGEALLEKCPDTKVNLNDPNVRVLTWVLDDLFLFGIDTTGISLHRRGYRIRKHPTSLNPVIAAPMIQISGWKKGTLVDPFCGSGTIPIEAYHRFKGIPNIFRDFAFLRLPLFNEEIWQEVKEKIKIKKGEPEIYCLDINKKFLQDAKQNASKANAKILFVSGNAEELHRYVGNVNYIITNPPYGLRMGNKRRVFKLYENFARELEEHFSGAIMVVITPHRKFEYYFDVLEMRDVLYGELWARIYKLKI